MADTYDVNGVSVSPAAGGYYDLTHPSLPDGTERVQGKEKADARAEEIAKAHAASGGIEGTGDRGDQGLGTQSTANGGSEETDPTKAVVGSDGTKMDVLKQAPTTDGRVDGDERSSAEKMQERAAADQGLMERKEPGRANPDASSDPKARGDHDDEVGALRSQLADMHDKFDKMMEAFKGVTTVHAEEAAAPESAIPALSSRHFNGEMSKDDRAALKKAGVDTRTIVLEENENIPPTGLFIGHNGRSYIIKPGEEVEVPKFLTDVLDDAVMSAPIVDSASQKVLGYRNRSRYPYRVVKG